MARKVNVRTVLNRQALDQMRAGWVDGFEDLALEVLAYADVPDADPQDIGLVERGGWGIWADGKKVAGPGNKPRGLRVKRYVVVMAVGYGFPGRFQETGTVNQPPNPFVTPAFLMMATHMQKTLGAKVVKRMERLR